MHFAKKILVSIVNLGVSKNQKVLDKQRTRNTNLLAVIPFPIYFFFIFWGVYSNFRFTIYLGASIILLQLFGLYLNFRKQYALAKVILYLGCNLVMLVAFNTSNVDYSLICFAFPILITFELVFDVKNEVLSLITSFSITVISILCCFILPKYIFLEHIIPSNLLKQFIALNYIFSFSLCIIFVLLIFKMHSKAQQRLIAAVDDAEKANKAKSDFLSNISHELRTPLNGIIGTTNLLLQEDDKDQQKKYKDVLQHTTDHLLNLINHILDFSKIKVGKIHLDSNVFNLKHILTKLCNVYKEQNSNTKIQFLFEIDESLDVQITSDDLRLKQILHNLLSNAFKFTSKGTVFFKATLKEVYANKMVIQFVVKDTGLGINDEQQKHIFESFEQADNSTTRNYGGTGLGLSICKELVALFGAQLHLQSQYQKGSTFSFEITVQKTAEEDFLSEKPTSNNLILKNINILVAEDNKVNMMVLLSFLKKWKATVDSVENGELALEAFKTKEYDLILMDLEMPQMDGYTAIKEIRKLSNTIPVIAFTAALYDGMASDLKNKGFNDYLHKPFNPSDLYNKISQYKNESVQ